MLRFEPGNQRRGTGIALGMGNIATGIGGLQQAAGQYLQAYYTDAERAALTTKAVGGALGTLATPMLRGAKGLFKPKPNDAPTPWFKRFYNELRGLRREESVFNRAQLRTLKEIEAKPGEGKGGGFMGMLMMLIGPLIAAIGAAITAGFGLLMKLPGMGSLAKLATRLIPAVLLPKRPITQPTTAPGGPGAPAGQTGQKKPTLWERTRTKVSGWMGKGKTEPVPTTPVQEIQGPPKPPGRLAKAAGAVKRMAKVLPVLGRLMTLFSVTSSVAASEGDDSLSRGEKDKRAGSAIGGGVGGVVGGALGAMVAGPIGAIVGSIVGDKVGAIVGEQVGGFGAHPRILVVEQDDEMRPDRKSVV